MSKIQKLLAALLLVNYLSCEADETMSAKYLVGEEVDPLFPKLFGQSLEDGELFTMDESELPAVYAKLKQIVQEAFIRYVISVVDDDLNNIRDFKGPFEQRAMMFLTAAKKLAISGKIRSPERKAWADEVIKRIPTDKLFKPTSLEQIKKEGGSFICICRHRLSPLFEIFHFDKDTNKFSRLQFNKNRDKLEPLILISKEHYASQSLCEITDFININLTEKISIAFILGVRNLFVDPALQDKPKVMDNFDLLSNPLKTDLSDFVHYTSEYQNQFDAFAKLMEKNLRLCIPAPFLGKDRKTGKLVLIKILGFASEEEANNLSQVEWRYTYVKIKDGDFVPCNRKESMKFVKKSGIK